MLCNTHVLYSLHFHVLHGLHEARTIRCNCISIAVVVGVARAAMATPVFTMGGGCASFRVAQCALGWVGPNDTPG